MKVKGAELGDGCVMCGATENLQIHHWLYGDEALEKKWTMTVCVECHQKLHKEHGVGHGEGYKLKKSPEIALRFFKAILENPQITTCKLAEEVGISEPTTRKLRRRWGLHKRSLIWISRSEFEKKLVWQLYMVLENIERLGKRERKHTVSVTIKGEALNLIREIKREREKQTGKVTSIVGLVREAIVCFCEKEKRIEQEKTSVLAQ